MLPLIVVKLIEFAQIVVVTGTVPFYTFILVFLVISQIKRVEELATPFFKLCISSSVIDLCTLFANYFGAMFPKFGYFSNFYLYLDGIYAHIYFYIAWSTGICQAMSVSILATNRLSAMIFPENYQRMWLGCRLKIAMTIQFVPGLIIGCFTFFNTTTLVPNEHGGIVPQFVDKKMTSTFFTIGGAFLFINCLYLILAYCYVFWSLKKRNLKISQSNMSITKQKIRKRELRLFIMCTIIVGVQLTVLLFFSLKLLKFYELTVDEFYLFYNALSDLFASINPYLLWIFSDSLRKYVIRSLRMKKERRKSELPRLTILSVAPVA